MKLWLLPTVALVILTIPFVFASAELPTPSFTVVCKPSAVFFPAPCNETQCQRYIESSTESGTIILPSGSSHYDLSSTIGRSIVKLKFTNLYTHPSYQQMKNYSVIEDYLADACNETVPIEDLLDQVKRTQKSNGQDIYHFTIQKAGTAVSRSSDPCKSSPDQVQDWMIVYDTSYAPLTVGVFIGRIVAVLVIVILLIVVGVFWYVKRRRVGS